MRKEIRIVGRGGQGVVLAGIIIGEAASRHRFKSVQTQTYGPEARGGNVLAEVVVSDKSILYPQVTKPDYLVALSQNGYDRYQGQTGKASCVIVDKDLVKAHSKTAVRGPFFRTAEQLGYEILANIVMLGFFFNIFQFTTEKVLRDTILRYVPRKMSSLNIDAFQQGYAMGGDL